MESTYCILYFVKYPVPGKVKTRLAKDSSPDLAAEFYSVFAREKLDELSKSKADVLVFYAPDTAMSDMAEWLGENHRYFAQKGGDLGRRMENAFREAFSMGYERAVLVGSDIPGLSSDIAGEGLRVLSPDAVCLGPADDGGYYCIGFHRKGLVPEAFRCMRWSTADVFQYTVNRLEDAGREIVELPRLEDTDTLEDVETLAALGSSGPLGGRALAVARKIVGM